MPDIDPPPPPTGSTSEKQVTTTDEKHEHRAISPIAAAGRVSTESTAAEAAKKILAHSGDADEAMKAFADGEVVEVDEATNRRLLRRIDRFMMPLMCVGMSLFLLLLSACGSGALFLFSVEARGEGELKREGVS